MILDFHDDDVRRMVQRHAPTEKWKVPRLVSEPRICVGVECDVCEVDWPCPPVQALRRWQEEQLKGMWKTNEEGK